MQKSNRRIHLAALLAASASAQTITSTIPVCPTASSTTITLPTTVTFCPGPHCNGGGSGPMVTPAPTNGVGMQGVHLGEYTSIGPDGKTTVLGIWETVFDSLCETGLVPATWTITEDCGCTEAPAPTVMPQGFETTVVPCSVCGPHSTVTLTQPCPTGPYASVTPSVGQAPAAAAQAPAGQAPAAASAGAGSGSGAGASSGPSGASAGAGSGAGAGAQAGSGQASAGAGSGAGATAQGPGGASAGAGSGSGAGVQAAPGQASAAAGSGAGATGQGPSGASAGSGSGSGAGAQAGPNGASVGAGAGAGAGANANGGTVSPASAAGGPAGPGGMRVAPVNGTGLATNGTKPATNAPIQSYVSSATHASIAGFTIFAGVIAAVLL